MKTRSDGHPRIPAATTLAGSLLALTPIAPWTLGQDPDPIAELRGADQNPDTRRGLMQGLDEFLEHQLDRELFDLDGRTSL